MALKQPVFIKSGVKQKTTKWYSIFTDHNGVRRSLPLFADRKNAVEAERAVNRLVGVRASGDFVPPDLQRWIENTRPHIRQKLGEWNIVDPSRVAAVSSLESHIADWEKALLEKGSSQEHVQLVVLRTKKLFAACGFIFWSDIKPEAVQAKLAEWRIRKDGPLSHQTSNFYLQSTKQFCKWMIRPARRATESPLGHLSGLNVKVDRRHDRRAYSVEEFRYLLAHLGQDTTIRGKMTSDERAVVYRLAVETGLRRGAIAALTRSSFKLDGASPCIHIPAGAKNKYKNERDVPLRAAMVTILSSFLANKMPTAPAFNLPPKAHGAKVIKADLGAARARWIEESQSPQEREEREISNFLKYEDDMRRFLDFHSFRHTRAVWLFQHHDASAKEVQELLGVSSIALVDRYSKSFKLNDLSVIERGPDLAPELARLGQSEVAKKTGTTDTDVQKSLPSGLPAQDRFRQISVDLAGLHADLEPVETDDQEVQKTAEKLGVLTDNEVSDIFFSSPGEVAEWLNAPVSKTG
jgi:integrase